MAFLLDYFYDLLGYFGLFKKHRTLIFLGLDNAGKTTLFTMLQTDCVRVMAPTIHPNSTEMAIGNCNATAFDLGGHCAARRLWKSYLGNVDGIVYLVDALDRDRFNEARRELDKILCDDDIAHVPVLVLGNKIDVTRAASEMELRQELGLMETTGKSGEVPAGQRPCEVFMCSVIRRVGYGDGLRWLSNQI